MVLGKHTQHVNENWGKEGISNHLHLVCYATWGISAKENFFKRAFHLHDAFVVNFRTGWILNARKTPTLHRSIWLTEVMPPGLTPSPSCESRPGRPSELHVRHTERSSLLPSLLTPTPLVSPGISQEARVVANRLIPDLLIHRMDQYVKLTFLRFISCSVF